MRDLAIVNGVIQDLHAAAIPATDMAFLRGCGAFETWRTYQGHPHALGEHLRRLWQAAALFGVQPFVSESTLRSWLQEGYQRSGYNELRVNAVCSPGDHEHGVFGAAHPRLVLLLRGLQEPPQEWYENGVAVILHQAERPLPEHKTVNYLCGREGLRRAEAEGAHEALYCDAQGMVYEGVTSNVHALFGNRVLSPAVNCLSGITRAGLRRLAPSLGLEWQDAPLHRQQLLTADEIWLSSAVRELVPVVQVEGQAIGQGRPGPMAQRLRSLYRADCERSARAEAAACS